MDSTTLEWIGYIASGIIALSMTMSSILKFRWINLAGAALFALYGVLIDALPVALMNLFIVGVDLYYLWKIFARKEVFEVMETGPGNKYLERFLDFHAHDIQKFFPGFTRHTGDDTHTFLILRDMAVAGVFMAHPGEENCLRVSLDYVLPEYRDFKNGRFIYLHLKERFVREGYNKVIAEEKSRKYGEYLQKTGFTLNSDGYFEKAL